MTVPLPQVFVIDAAFAAAFVSLQVAMLGATAWLVVDRIRLENRLTRLEGAVESHAKAIWLLRTHPRPSGNG